VSAATARAALTSLLLRRCSRRFLERKPGILPCRAVVVDGAQDLHLEEWKLVRALVPEVPNDLSIAGDAHQRIYARKVVLGRCGIDVRGVARRTRRTLPVFSGTSARPGATSRRRP